jgi:hypothetical protein
MSAGPIGARALEKICVTPSLASEAAEPKSQGFADADGVEPAR